MLNLSHIINPRFMTMALINTAITHAGGVLMVVKDVQRQLHCLPGRPKE